MSEGYKVQITVAWIGVAGVIAAALISNLDKFFPRAVPVVERTVSPPEQTPGDATPARQRPPASTGDGRPGATSPVAFALGTYVFPRERALWPARRATALSVMQDLDLLPLVGRSPSARLAHILNDGDRDQERRALAQGLIDSANVDEAARTELREALGN